MFKYDNLYSLVFDKSVDATDLIIVTGYIGPAIVQDLKESPYNTKVFVGMYGSTISSIIHNSLLKSNSFDNVKIFYTKILVHSKCYIWKKGEQIVRVLIGSANFSTSGLRTPKKEILGELGSDTFDQILTYLRLIESDSYSVKDYVPGISSTVGYFDEVTQSISEREVEISLLAARSGGSDNILGVSTNPGDVHASAGLNWGFSNGLPKPNDAYIKIPVEQINNNPMMFPEKNDDVNDPIDVIWDDGTEMQLLLEGNQTAMSKNYPKQISSYKNKSVIGIYLRKRIGEKLGKDLVLPDISKDEFKDNAMNYKDKLITKDMLIEYGRSSINIKLIGDRTYYFDFSVK